VDKKEYFYLILTNTILLIIVISMWIGLSSNGARVNSLIRDLRSAKNAEQSALNKLANIQKQLDDSATAVNKLRETNKRLSGTIDTIKNQLNRDSETIGDSTGLIKEFREILETIKTRNN
jgi:peptidoglycan hydrolase CwlO-like protein